LLRVIRKEKITIVFTRKDLPFPIRWLAKALGLSLINMNEITNYSGSWLPPQQVPPDQPALITHSSGSTGTSKAIYRSHCVLTAQHLALKTAFPPRPEQHDFPLFPNILLHNLAVGTVTVFPDLPGFSVLRMSPARIVEQILGNGIQTLTGNVYYFTRLLGYLRSHPVQMAGVRAIGIGGSPVPEHLAHSLRSYFPSAEVYIIYGSSEAEPIAIRKLNDQASDPRLGYAVGSLHPSLRWRIVPGSELRFPDGTNRKAGELEVSGAHVVAAGKDGWFRTGDFGYTDNNGQLFLTGRSGNEKVHGGMQHYQVEHVLAHLKGVDRAAARTTESGFVVFVEGKAPEEYIRQALAENFPPGIIKNVNFRQKLPVDSRHHSKIKYDQLK
jgi:acyl-CoA synthetase (AMP-forming)/AMP-acid ligase II